MTNNAYSFLDAQVALVGPNGAVSLSNGGIADEGVSYEMEGDKGTMVTGADGGFMHSLHAAQSGTVTVRLLKTSPLNGVLQTMYNAQTASSANYGQNTITIRDPVRGDSITAQGCAFRKQPNNNFSKEGNTLEWVFNSGRIDVQLGQGSPSLI